MNRPKFAEGDMDAHGLWIFRITGVRLESRTVSIHSSCATQGCLDGLSIRRDDQHIETENRNLIARFGNRVLRAGIRLRVRILDEVVCCRVGLCVGPMIDELSNRNPRCLLYTSD